MTDAATPAAGAFVATDGGSRWRFEGALTLDNAAGVLEAASELPLPSAGVVDFDGLRHADSAALAVMIALKRRAHRRGPLDRARGRASDTAVARASSTASSRFSPHSARSAVPRKSMSAAVEVAAVARRYGSVQALAGIDLTVAARASSSGCSARTARARRR